MAKPLVIDCPHPDCSGKFLMGTREIVHQAGTGARVVLRCTRNPDEHNSAILVEPYSEREVQQLASALARGERLLCGHCETELRQADEEMKRAWGWQRENAATHHCPWCGVRWRAPSEAKLAAGSEEVAG